MSVLHGRMLNLLSQMPAADRQTNILIAPHERAMPEHATEHATSRECEKLRYGKCNIVLLRGDKYIILESFRLRNRCNIAIFLTREKFPFNWNVSHHCVQRDRGISNKIASKYLFLRTLTFPANDDTFSNNFLDASIRLSLKFEFSRYDTF